MGNEKSLFARQRILVSRLVIWPLATVLLVTTSAWASHSPDGPSLHTGLDEGPKASHAALMSDSRPIPTDP